MHFYVNYLAAALIVILALGFAIFYFLYYSRGEEVKITDVMAYLTGSVAIVTLLYHIINMEWQDKNQKDSLKLRRHQYTYDVISRLTDPKMGEYLSILAEIKDHHIDKLKEKNIQEFMDFLKENNDKRIKLVVLINLFEQISILVEKNHVEEYIVKEALKTLFTDAYSMLRAYINERQVAHRRNWIHFEELSVRWSKEK